MDAAAGAAAADCDGWDSAGERDVGVGGAEPEFSAKGEVAVDGAEGVEQWGVVGERGCGAVSYGFDVEFGWWRRGFLCGGGGDDLFEDLPNGSGSGDELDGVGGADVEERGGGLGDGVDRSSTPDHANVESGLR